MSAKRRPQSSSNQSIHSNPLLELASNLRDALIQVDFSESVAWVYHPLSYAWDSHAEYLLRYGTGTKRVLFLGMNPGPWGMMQTGIPFGEIAAVRDFLQIDCMVGCPERFHPKRPIQGMDCKRSEVSGKRFWGLFRSRFGNANRFFQEHFVANYCPVAFLEASGRNLTPDKLPVGLRSTMDQLCLQHLLRLIELMRPEWVVGVGAFAADRAERMRACMMDIAPATFGRTIRDERKVDFRIATILHPSPASPLANRDWEGKAVRQLVENGVWKE